MPRKPKKVKVSKKKVVRKKRKAKTKAKSGYSVKY